MLVGCAAVPYLLNNEPQYAAAVAAQANLLVAENAMKWAALRPAPDQFNFAAADALFSFAAQHGQKVRGHNLCWHEALPKWFATTATAQNARQLLTTHIETVAGRYAGRIHSWDVVNEAIDPKSDRPDGLRKSPWLDLAGNDYVELAFKTARRVDRAALLTYNDYDIELDTPPQTAKRALVLSLVKRLKALGVIDAVGVQSHLSASGPMPGDGLRTFVRELNAMGLQVFITEMDVSDQKLPGSAPERDQAVANVYAQYLALMFAEPNVTAALTWGITDRYTWIGHERPRADGLQPRPLPLDADYRPTPAFFAMRDALDARSTRAAARQHQS
jgi:endo-1,4-beta-xylanase